MEFTHLNEDGRGRMVDVSGKSDTKRTATARGKISLNRETLEKVRQGSIAKGDVLSVAQIAGILAAKKTAELIPLCHNILLHGVDLKFEITESGVTALAAIHTMGPTGAEMEALTAVTTALLTVYDMCKAVDKGMVISDIMLLEKTGGKSGIYRRNEDQSKLFQQYEGDIHE